MTNPEQQWGLKFVEPQLAIAYAHRMGPGPYQVVPFGTFMCDEQPSNFVLGLWVPELSGLAEGRITHDEHGRLEDQWERDAHRVSIRPLYIGPQGQQYVGDSGRTPRRRVASAMRVEIWAAVHEVTVLLLQSPNLTVGRSWQETDKRAPRLVGFWEEPGF